MKNTKWLLFVLWLSLVALSCTDAPTEAGKMPIGPITPGSYVAVTPDPAPAPLASAQAPTATMPVVGADLQVETLQSLNSRTEQIANLGALAAFNPASGIPEGFRVKVFGFGWYEFTTSGAIPAAGSPWIITGVGGKWLREGYYDALSAGNGIVASGPVSGEAFSEATPAGKINKDHIIRGYRTHRLLPEGAKPLTFATTSVSAVNFTLFGVSADEVDFGTLAIADIVDFRVDATANGNSAAAFPFLVSMQYSENGGGSWTDAHFNGIPYRANSTNDKQMVQLSFTHQIAAAGDFKVRCRVVSDGTHQVVVTVDSWYGLVTRP